MEKIELIQRWSGNFDWRHELRCASFIRIEPARGSKIHINDSTEDCYDDVEGLFFEWSNLSPCSNYPSGLHSHLYIGSDEQLEAQHLSKSSSKGTTVSSNFIMDEGFDSRGNPQCYIELFLPTSDGFPPLEWAQCISHSRQLMVTVDYLNENLELFGRVRFENGIITKEAHWTEFEWQRDYHQNHDAQGNPL